MSYWNKPSHLLDQVAARLCQWSEHNNADNGDKYLSDDRLTIQDLFSILNLDNRDFPPLPPQEGTLATQPKEPPQ